ncbi:DUF1493 family protein [Paraburkholderia ferrariae]|uniref:DUF1493 family protein n=1 Tax=Paraburkholderia ferrariae TaxID=386056 RepID=UPI000485248A|nr:DUF1493 family protein [Paraburkholderia ferrariae]
MTQQKGVSVELEAFFRKEAGVPDKLEILPSSVIEDDFGITGDDANILMDAFFREFPVERGDYDFHRYFEMEASGFPIPFLDKWIKRRILGARQYVRQSLNVSMLQRAIDRGIWDSQSLQERGDTPPPGK